MCENITASNITASNLVSTVATITTIYVEDEIITPGADYAEFIAKADPSASNS